MIQRLAAKTTTLQLFSEATPPTRLRFNKLAMSNRWLTWSPAFYQLVKKLRQQKILNQRVSIVRVPACEPYASTYTSNFTKLDPSIQEPLLACARSIGALRCGNKAIFFRDMISSRLSGPELHVIFALLREAIISMHANPAASLYSPVSPERKDPGFNLHADLYLTTKLWLIFEDVPNDGTGASLFLSRSAFLRCMRGVAAISKKASSEIVSLLDKPFARDSYNRMYDLIYDAKNYWCEEIQASMKKSSQTIPLFYGEGYLIDDRKWLHGRTPVSIAVSRRRFHRLTYDLTRAR
jgi:hypothetical protein